MSVAVAMPVQAGDDDVETRQALKLPDFAAPRQWRDVVFGVVFLLSFLATVGFGIHGLLKLRDRVEMVIDQKIQMIEDLPFGDRIRAELEEGFTALIEANAKPFVETLLICSGVSLIFAIGYLVLLERFVGFVVRIVIALTVLSSVAFIAVNAVILNVPFVIIGVLFLIYKCAWYWFMRHRMQFAKRVVKSSIRALVRFGFQTALLIVTLSIIQTAWCALCVGAYFAVTKGSGFEALVFLSFWWGLEVIANVGHVTLCTALGRYFVTGEKTMLFGVRNALTWSFGSICFGSLLVALLKLALYFFRKWKKSKNPLVKWCGFCCFCCLNSLLQLFNTYAFVRVGLYNESYWGGAKFTAAMLKKKGLDVVAGNVLVRDLIGVGSSIGSIVAGTTAALVALVAFKMPLIVSFAAVVLALIIGYAILYVSLVALESAVATFFTVWHIDDALFKDVKGYAKLKESFEKKLSKKERKARVAEGKS
jgi:hypothetical protein